jgi:hypothetical protein
MVHGTMNVKKEKKKKKKFVSTCSSSNVLNLVA